MGECWWEVVSYQIGLDGRREKKGKKERMGPEHKEQQQERQEQPR